MAEQQEARAAAEAVELEQWEHCKENIVPLRRGRNAHQLAAACAEIESKEHIEEQRKEWEDKIAKYAGEDPLDLWARYVDWAQQSYVTDEGRQLLVALIERCTTIFSGEALPQHCEDPRLLRIWLAYTDYCEDPLEVFNFLKSNKVGYTEAIFYERWASALELRGNQALCQKVYEAGIQKGAHPVDWLKSRYKAFQMRLVQRVKATASQGLSATSSTSSAPASAPRRSALAPLGSAGGAMRPSAQIAPRAGSTAMGSGVRLGGASARSSAFATAVNGKTMSKSDIYVDPIHADAPAATSRKAASTATAASSVTPRGGQQQLPHVASASSAADTPSECGSLSEGKWRALAPLKERQKENRAVPQKWSDTAVPQKPSASTKQPAAGFTIYVDDEFQEL